jgi:hypothetical protein
MLTENQQKGFNQLKDAIDNARTNGLLDMEAEAVWDAMCECMDDEDRFDQGYLDSMREMTLDES